MNWIKLDHHAPFESGAYVVAFKEGTYGVGYYSEKHNFFAIPIKDYKQEDIVAWCSIDPCEFIPDVSEGFNKQLDQIIELVGKDKMVL